MASIQSTAKWSTLTSSEALERDEDVPDTTVMWSSSLAPILEVMKELAKTKKRKVDEVGEEGEHLDDKASDAGEHVTEEDYDLQTLNPSYIDIGQSVIKPMS
jgi:hypothetical protein